MHIPLIPTHTTFMPGYHVELLLTNPKSIKAIQSSMKYSNYQILTSKQDNQDICNIGVLGKIINIIEYKPFKVLIHITDKTKIFNINHKPQYLLAQYKIINNSYKTINEQLIKTLNQNLIKYSNLTNNNYFDKIYNNLPHIELLPNQICATMSNISSQTKQKTLECSSLQDKITCINNDISKYLAKQKNIDHKNTLLHDDENTDTTADAIIKIKNILKKNISSEAKQQIEQTLNKIDLISPQHPEYFNQMQYINTLIKLPWEKEKIKKYTLLQKHNILQEAKNILEESHYGIQQTKNYILEYIASYLHNPVSLKNQTLCFIGPPGTGKTSLSYTISKCLNRPHITIPIGGMRDATDLRGHQRTYLSSLPGKIMNAILMHQTTKIVILLDEMDKLSNAEKNDIYGVIIELLDPTQQTHFLDNYINIPFDISNILFLATANNQSLIPSPIQNRLEIINIENYSDKEKLHITKKYIIPKNIKKYQITQDIKLSDKLIQYIIDHYTYEAGVRQLNRTVEKIIRKILFNTLQNKTKTIKPITIKNIKKHLGNIKYTALQDVSCIRNRIGLMHGLAVTSHGGRTITIETILLKDTNNTITCTGNLSKVMLESANIAYNYCLTLEKRYNIPSNIISDNRIHFHITEGSIEKDGPSAGLGICLAIISNFLQKPIPEDITVTGEITLLGDILPIGGIYNKLLAAIKIKKKKVIIPYKNMHQLQDIDNNILKKIKIYPVKTAIEAINLCLSHSTSENLLQPYK